MRHRNRGRKLGRNPNHQRALLRSLASALILTERDPELYDTTDPTAPKPPKVRGRIITTIHKAKEVRPLVERCITIARRALPQQEAADRLEPDADRNSPQWREWRQSDRWREWNQTVAPVVAARRRALKLLGNKEAVQILFDEIAPRMADRDGGYTRVLRLAKPRLGDAGTRAILEFVGKNDRERQQSRKPAVEQKPEVAEEPQADGRDINGRDVNGSDIIGSDIDDSAAETVDRVEGTEAGDASEAVDGGEDAKAE